MALLAELTPSQIARTTHSLRFKLGLKENTINPTQETQTYIAQALIALNLDTLSQVEEIHSPLASHSIVHTECDEALVCGFRAINTARSRKDMSQLVAVLTKAEGKRLTEAGCTELNNCLAYVENNLRFYFTQACPRVGQKKKALFEEVLQQELHSVGLLEFLSAQMYPLVATPSHESKADFSSQLSDHFTSFVKKVFKKPGRFKKEVTYRYPVSTAAESLKAEYLLSFSNTTGEHLNLFMVPTGEVPQKEQPPIYSISKYSAQPDDVYVLKFIDDANNFFIKRISAPEATTLKDDPLLMGAFVHLLKVRHVWDRLEKRV